MMRFVNGDREATKSTVHFFFFFLNFTVSFTDHWVQFMFSLLDGTEIKYQRLQTEEVQTVSSAGSLETHASVGEIFPPSAAPPAPHASPNTFSD